MTRLLVFEFYCELGGRNHTRGANVSASAAVDASFGVDRVDFAFADRGSGTFVDASATSNAIFANDISHDVRI